MPTGYEYAVHEGSFDGPVIGAYLHADSNDLAGPRLGEIIELTGRMGRWRVTDREAIDPQRKGRLAVERVDDELVSPHGD